MISLYMNIHSFFFGYKNKRMQKNVLSKASISVVDTFLLEAVIIRTFRSLSSPLLLIG